MAEEEQKYEVAVQVLGAPAGKENEVFNSLPGILRDHWAKNITINPDRLLAVGDMTCRKHYLDSNFRRNGLMLGIGREYRPVSLKLKINGVSEIMNVGSP
jgi:hypothetical protein